MSDGLHQALALLLGDRLFREQGQTVAAPATEEELVAILRALEEHRGQLGQDLILSRRAFSTIGLVDERSGVVEVGAGVPLDRLERELRARELSLGPLCPSLRSADVASYLEGPHAGLRALPGGRLETACLALAGVMPGGLRFGSRASPRSAAGPDLDSLFLGADGRFGLVVRATLRLFPRAELSKEAAFSFPTVKAALLGLRGALAGGVWMERVHCARREERTVVWARVMGSSAGVERDLLTLGQQLVAADGRPYGHPTPGVTATEERELNWDEVDESVEEGAELTLWRLGLESVVAVGTGGRGLPLVGGGWADAGPLRAALAQASPGQTLGGPL